MTTWIPILVLSFINLAAALFMIHESAGYYQMLYPEHVILIPWGAAILAEVFQHILMIMKGDSIKLDRFFKGLAVMLFSITVSAAGLKVYKPIKLAESNTKRKSQLVSILKQEIQDNRNDQNLFSQIGTRQKLNAAIAVKERREAYRELKDTLESQPSHKVNHLSMFEIVQLFLLRIVIQMSALVCAWKIGKLYRSRDQRKTTNNRQIIKKWKAKYLRAENGFIGIVQYNDGTFLSVLNKKKKPFKTFNGAMQFFKGTRFEGRIPSEPTENSLSFSM